ncbi:MAG: ABC transporter ATP-binding protein [Terriglobia bacterium]
MSPSSAVVLQQVGFTYAALQARPALSDISLTINEGEIFGFLGPNGSGKTTLFGIVATLLTPTMGRAELLGLETRLAADALRAKIGVVFQKHSLDQKLSVSENLRHHGHLYGMWGQRLHQRINAVLAQFDLRDRAEDRVETLSEGLKRRTELAKVFVHDPRVFILDEPTAGLDPRARLEFWKELKSIHVKHSRTILVTTHMMDEAEHCQRLAFLNHGTLAAVDTPTALKEQVQGSVITIRAREPDAPSSRPSNKKSICR